ncbi:MAG: NAD-dependent epimerase/dehydratase family protein, partial [Candidatus Odinarchaeota archaeon]
VDRVIHLAAAANDDIDMPTLLEVNVGGTENLLKAVFENKQQIFFCHLSSSGVYGSKLPNVPISEDYRKNPYSNYQRSKWLTEQVVWDYLNRGVKGTVLRPPSIIGPEDLKTFYRIVEAVQNRKFPLLGGNNYLTFVDVDDLSRALVLSASRDNQEKSDHKAFNIYSFSVTLKKLLDRIVEETGSEKPKKHNYRLIFTLAVISELYTKITGRKTILNRYRVRKFGSSRRYDMSRIKSELAYEPIYGFDETIKRSFAWLYENGYLKR